MIYLSFPGSLSGSLGGLIRMPFSSSWRNPGSFLTSAEYLDDAEKKERDIRPADSIVRVLFIIGLPDSYDSEDEKGQD